VSSWDSLDPSLWPSAAHRLILRAALLDGEPAQRAWREWLARDDIASLDCATSALLPRLYLNFKDAELESQTRSTLRGVYGRTWAKNQIRIQWLLNVLRQLEEQSISAIVLKGVPLLLFYYRDPGARIMADVDVLIRQTDLERAAAVLRAADWRLEKPLPPKSIAPIVRALHCVHPEQATLDLHWRPFTIDCPPDVEEGVWQRAETYEVQGVRMLVPCRTDLFLLMCMHGRKQERQAVCRWVVDAMVMISSADQPIDWEALLGRSKETGLLPPVRDALTYLHREFGAEIPEDFLERVRSISTSREDGERYRELVRQGSLQRGLSELLASHWWQYSAAHRSRGEHPTAFGFIGYLTSFKLWEWQLRHGWQFPIRAVKAVASRIVSSGL
jgi:hypothetical protein